MICSICRFLWARCHGIRKECAQWTVTGLLQCRLDTAVTHCDSAWCLSATTANAIMRVQASGYRRTEKGNLLPKTMGVSRGFGDLKSRSRWG